MSNYIKTTNFLAKDALPAGDSNKKIRGAEFNVEFDNIQTAVNSKSDSNNGIHTGTSTFENITSSGVGTFANLVATTANIDGGTIDGTSIGGTSASSGAFTTLTASGATTLATLSATNVSYTGTLTGGTGIINIGSGQIYKDAAGNVGVGTTSPTAIGSSRVVEIGATTGNSAFQLFSVAGTLRGAIFANASEASVGSISSIPLLLKTNDTERARITSGGDYYIGHTGTRTGLVTFYTNSDVINAHSGQAAGTARSLFTGWHSATATTSGTLSYNVTTNGNVTNTNNSYGSLSDIKLKENVTPATNKLDDLIKVEFVNFNFINDPDKRKQFGVIAQQLETVFPGLVESTPDTEEVEVTDDEGNVFKERRETGTFTKSVNYSVLALMACKALQEANAKIELLTERIVALENK